MTCLEESFLHEGFYVTAFNADTEHEEGATYLWSREELAGMLTPEEFEAFSEVYHITGEGNFEGRNHLIRKNDRSLEEIERKLLTIRNLRSQPSRDNKILSGLNALVAVALIQAGRLLDQPELEEKGSALTERLVETFRNGTSLGHSRFNGKLHDQPFLTDICRPVAGGYPAGRNQQQMEQPHGGAYKIPPDLQRKRQMGGIAG